MYHTNYCVPDRLNNTILTYFQMLKIVHHLSDASCLLSILQGGPKKASRKLYFIAFILVTKHCL